MGLVHKDIKLAEGTNKNKSCNLAPVGDYLDQTYRM